MVRIVGRMLYLTSKEYLCFTDMFDRLKKYSYPPLAEKVERILKAHVKNRLFSNEELEVLMKWRRPKGTPFATPCYLRFLNSYFKVRHCPKCRGSGHIGQDFCEVCKGKGRNPQFPIEVMSFQEWINQIEDDKMHHLGEYYTYLTGKPFQRKDHLAMRVGYIRWLKENYYNGKLGKLDLSRFSVYSAKMGEGFLFRRKEGN